MMRELSKIVTGIEPSGIRKFFDIVMEMKDAVSLGVGEPDFDTPWPIREEGIYSLERGRTFYTSNAGLAELRAEIAKYISRLIGVDYAPEEEVIVTVGGSEGIDLAVRTLMNPGDEMIIPQPSFVCYEPVCRLAGGQPVIIDLKEGDDFKLRPEQVERAITDKTKVLLLTFPNNPTGSIMTREELLPIAELCIKHDLYVISDEIYAELTYGGKHVSIAALPGMRERTVVINGFSKAFAMTGWRLGFVCAPSFMAEHMYKVHQFGIMCAPTNAQYAAVVALRDCMRDVEKMVREYNRRRLYLINRLRRMGIDCFEPFGAFYVFPSIRRFGLISEEFATRLLMEQKVAVVPGTAFGRCGEGYLRISYAYSLADLKEALDRMEAFVKGL
ncbi:MAG: aminotransferase class I/II-fold pyridoxal phosphate-dependent enzyme [Eubacteriales bacterium]|nr:aminotransferase class I/II-fold pyridoxal phosphate-dependent enzyme [Eubacteriales bacterium]